MSSYATDDIKTPQLWFYLYDAFYLDDSKKGKDKGKDKGKGKETKNNESDELFGGSDYFQFMA